MRRAGMALGLVGAVAALGCKCRADPPPAESPLALPSVPPVPSGFVAGARRFDADVEHPYNAVHRALFDRESEANVPDCVDAGTCVQGSPMAPLGGPSARRRVHLGGDELAIFSGPNVDYLAEAARATEVERAVERALGLDPTRAPIAALLLQNDLWDRYDQIFADLAKGDRAGGDELRRVQRAVVRLIRHLALAPAAIGALPDNLAEVEAAYPTLIPGLSRRQGWTEIRTRANERRSEPLRYATRHTRVAGHRLVFRVLVAAPGGVLRLPTSERPSLPPGTRFALVASPLAIARGAELVASPLVTLIELRVASSESFVARSLTELPFDVLDGRRALLTQVPRPGGGLERLAPDALVPLGATCMPSMGVLVPMRSACPNCHGMPGATLTGPMTHGDVVFEEEPDPKAAFARTIAEKGLDPAFAALLPEIRSGP